MENLSHHGIVGTQSYASGVQSDCDLTISLDFSNQCFNYCDTLQLDSSDFLQEMIYSQNSKYYMSRSPRIGYYDERYGHSSIYPLYSSIPTSEFLSFEIGNHSPRTTSYQLYVGLHDNEGPSQSLLQKLELSGRVPSREKFRRMICQTYVCCGGCPYNERCVFLHDERIELKGFKTRPNKQTKSSTGTPKDSFFWPDMSKDKIYQKLDYLGLPTVTQYYHIPKDFASRPQDYHDRAVYSMWNHFVAYCIKLNHEKSNFMDDIFEQTYVDSPFSKQSLLSPKSIQRHEYFNDRNNVNEGNKQEESVVALTAYNYDHHDDNDDNSNDDDPTSPINRYMPLARRLPVFVALSSTESETSKQTKNMESFSDFSFLKEFVPEEYLPFDLKWDIDFLHKSNGIVK